MPVQAEQTAYLMVKMNPDYEDMLNQGAKEHAEENGLSKPDKSAYVRSLIARDRKLKNNRKKPR